MKVGKMDGFCVGEPWNARAIADGIGFTAINTQDIWKDHPEKVCAFTGRVRGQEPEDGQGRAEGAARSQRLARRHGEPPRAGARSSRRPPTSTARTEIILGRLQGNYDFGDGRKKQDPNYMIFTQPQLQLPAAQVRDLVADAVPPLGHGRRARPTTRASPSRSCAPTSTRRP